MKYVSYKIDLETKQKIENFYEDYKVPNDGDYICFFAKVDNLAITIYESKKGYKVVFTGKNALYEAKIFNPDAEISESKSERKIEFIDLNNQCGSDEVGFGDFFGPLVVVGVYFDSSLTKKLDSIKDSKKLTDEFILSFVPTIIKNVTFSKLTVHNEKYNSLIKKGYNMNQIKAMLHNRVLLNLQKRKPDCKTFYIDQFCDEKLYYKYLKNEKEIVRNITFKTKGESYYPSVALASMIARYCFLQEMDVLSKKYNMNFPKGASKTVDEFATVFIQKYSLEELKKVCKTNFTNFSKLDMH